MFESVTINKNRSLTVSAKEGNGSFFKPIVQPKLAINQPNDEYEQEADAMADKVMRMPDPAVGKDSFFKPAISSIQRKCQDCEEEEKKMQRKESNSDAMVADAATESYIGSLNSKGKSLTQEERSFFEPRFGYDFSNVQLHTNNEANESAKSVNALAYTQGNNIVFGSGQYQSNTDNGKQLMAHELTHVVQQNNGESNQPKKIQRFLSTEPAGGCGLCYGLPRNAGIAAHSLIQTEFEILYPLGLVELPISSPTDDNGRLDLAVATPTGLEIGEIKPANENGYANGITDIAFYLAALSAAFPTITIRPLTRLIPPIIFPSLSPNCPVQSLVVNPPVSGVYGYWCKPGYSESLSKGCNCKAIEKYVPERKRVPERRKFPEQTPELRRDPAFMEKMAAITGLSGTALIIYLIISEGSRAFPPRNLIPVP